MRNRALSALCVVSAAINPVCAQRASVPGPTLSRLDVSILRQDTVIRQHASFGWRKPALIGGTVVGSLSGLVSIAFCGDFDSGNNTPLNYCPAQDGVAFLIGAAVGGTLVALITASPAAPRIPADYVVNGNRGAYGALMLGVPSAALLAVAMSRPCRRQVLFPAPSSSSGCSIGSIASGLAMVAVNTGVGYLIGKGIPAFRPAPALR
jgi:hypothetical protein